MRVRIASAVTAVESVLGAPDDVASYSLIERAARLNRLTNGAAFPWLPALRELRDRQRRPLRPPQPH